MLQGDPTAGMGVLVCLLRYSERWVRIGGLATGAMPAEENPCEQRGYWERER